MYAEYIHVSRYLLICVNNPALEGQNHFRNICVRMQNTYMYLGTCSYTQIIHTSVGRSKSFLGMSAYVRRIRPCLWVLAHMHK